VSGWLLRLAAGRFTLARLMALGWLWLLHYGAAVVAVISGVGVAVAVIVGFERPRRRAGQLIRRVQRQLGHSSITVTFDVYGHLFPDDMERLAERMDVRVRAAAGADFPRTSGASGASRVGGPEGRNRPLSWTNTERARRDSNPRPSD
jgi:hypothetical protein